MAIDYFSLLADDGWEPWPNDQQASTHRWFQGGSLADAHVAAEETFAGKLWIQTKMDPAFKIRVLRSAPDFTLPRHHHSADLLTIVLQGQVEVRSELATDQESRIIGPGGFWIDKAGASVLTTAGPEGVVYSQTWSEADEGFQTLWHDEGWIAAV